MPIYRMTMASKFTGPPRSRDNLANVIRTPLYFAIAHATDYGISRLLIDKGADLNNSSIDGSSPLHTFFNKVVARVVQCHGGILEANTKNSMGRTALHYLSWSSRSTIRDAKAYLSDISSLITQDEDGRAPLHFAARRGNIELAKHFLDLLPPDKIDQADCNGQTAFHYAVESKRVEVLDILNRGGMDIFRKDRQRRSVLHQAAFHGNVEAVKRVIAIAGKRELEIKDIDGRTPLHVAHRYGAHSVVEYLQSSYGLSPWPDAAMTTTSDSRSPPWLDYIWKKTIVRGLDDLRPVLVAALVVYLICFVLRDEIQGIGKVY